MFDVALAGLVLKRAQRGVAGCSWGLDDIANRQGLQ